MAHTLTDLIQTKVIPGLYQQYAYLSQTAWMEANANRLGASYRGGKYLYLTEMIVEGMANYDRQLGYVNGNVTGDKTQFLMTQDRGRRFTIDYIDNDETGFLLSVANVLAEYNRSHVIPEIDCYRISKMYADVLAAAPTHVSAAGISDATITETLVDDIAAIRDVVGPGVPLVIMMSGLVQKFFGREWIHNLDYVSLNAGVVTTKVRAIDGDPFIILPSARMKSAYTFYDGISAGQEAGGFIVAGGALDIKWIITPSDGPVAVMKQDKTRVFDPNTNQQANAWAVDHRIFHDLWMFPNAAKNTFIRTGAIS